MLHSLGYTNIAEIYRSPRTQVLRARQERENLPVVVKILSSDNPAPSDVGRLRHEFEISSQIDVACSPRVIKLEKLPNSYAIVFEDCGGDSLQALALGGRMPLADFLRFGMCAAQILGELSEKFIIHKDVNPTNIIYSKDNGGQVRLIDFGLAEKYNRKTYGASAPDSMEGTLAYMAPEQTGRMNRPMDHRANLYSLGATFYWLLTGAAPFANVSDPLELAYCHIAKSPAPPHEVNTGIPRAVSEIVMKLLAKDPEERYLSAFGLKADLEECLVQHSRSGKVEVFTLGAKDVSETFRIPQRLYGRKLEIETLMEAFERVAHGATELMLVAGYSGIGKTSLVREINKPITGRKGYFIEGKFDQFKRNIPYASLIQAFTELIRQILTESQESVAQWKEKLQTALGANGAVITQVIPELELIIGKQPPAPELAAAESQNRFNYVFQNFVRTFCAAEHPLALFMDDLQWADPPSLQAMEQVLTDIDSRHILIISAYRDNEVDDAHPMFTMLENLKKMETTYHSITLGPLNQKGVNWIVADTLRTTIEETERLAEVLHGRTQGNPFFLNQLLGEIYEQGHISFHDGRWRWDMAAIERLDVGEDVVAFMAGKLRQMPESAQRALNLASFAGASFTLEMLATIIDKTQEETEADLGPALEEGMVIRQAKRAEDKAEAGEIVYTFIHDRVQQAAYSLVPSQGREALHLKVGRLLLQRTPEAERDERIFDIVGQLNKAVALITDPAERLELAKLNLAAGKKAKDSAAFAPALEYFKQGIDLLTEGSWESEYRLTLGLFEGAAEAAYMTSDYELMERHVEPIIKRAKDVLDTANAYQAKLRAYTGQNMHEEAIKVGLEVLARLGFPYPEHPGMMRIILELLWSKLVILGKTDDYFIDLPDTRNPNFSKYGIVSYCMGASSYFANQNLLASMTIACIRRISSNGFGVFSDSMYASYSLGLCGPPNDFNSAYRFAIIAEKAGWQRGNAHSRARTAFINYGFTYPWKIHVKHCYQPMLEAYNACRDYGDLEYAAYNASYYVERKYFSGVQLGEVLDDMTKFHLVYRQIKQEQTFWHTSPLYQALLNLTGKNDDPKMMIGEKYDERIMPERLKEMKNMAALFDGYFFKLYLCLIFQKPIDALEASSSAEPLQDGRIASFFIPLYHFYDALACMARYPDVNTSEKRIFLKRAKAGIKKMRNWSNHAPMNHEHRWHLMNAEMCRVLNKPMEAREHYDQAIAHASENGFTQDVALANELAGRFCIERKQSHMARYYLKESHAAYAKWGAVAKVRDIETRYSEHFTQPKVSDTSKPESAPSSTTHSTTSSSDKKAQSALDLPSLFKASQAISSEIDIDKLLKKLMRIMIENAGAEKGYLILRKGEELFLEAEEHAGGAEACLAHIPVDQYASLPKGLIHYVARTGKNVVLSDAAVEGMFRKEEYIALAKPRSVICVPVSRHGEVVGVLYMENNQAAGAFSPERVEALRLLSREAAISIYNARLYAEVRESEAKHRSIMENATEGIFQTTPEGKPITANPAMARMLGYDSPQELLSIITNVASKVYADPDRRKEFIDQIREHGFVKDFEFDALKKDGSTIKASMNATAVLDESGRPVLYQGIIRDVTEAKKVEQELAEQRDRLERAFEERTAELRAEKEKVGNAQKALARFVAPQIAEKALAGRMEEVMGHKRLKLTLFFSDIVDFTASTDSMEPEDMVNLLNEYFHCMHGIVAKYGGTVANVIGDAYYIFFGAPEFTNDKDHALRCARMAIEMQEEMRRLQKKWFEEGVESLLSIRCGINTGMATVGSYGSEERIEYSAFGTQVNLASRLESACRPGYILVSHSTWALIKDEIPCEEKETITVKGIHRPVRTYEIDPEKRSQI
ncbi:MAG: AAA family ATPase [Nitrospinota bacterium]|nr:AAA family ATPase [Nitrospinota bacterium]